MEPNEILDHIDDEQTRSTKSTIGFTSSSSSSSSPEQEEDCNSIINSSNGNGIESSTPETGTSGQVAGNDQDDHEQQQQPTRTDNSDAKINGDRIIIDVYDDDSGSEEKVCRICHLRAESEPCSSGSAAGLMELGCSCKGELSICHQRCAETWFKHKGNSVCEVCGERAKNVKLVKNYNSRMFIVDYDDVIIRPTSRVAEEERSGWCQQSCCNFLLVFFVLGLVVPWFFKTHLL